MAELPTIMPEALAGQDDAATAVYKEYFIRHTMSKGYQLFSLLTPPIYCFASARRYGRAHLTINRVLRATWVGGATGESLKQISFNNPDLSRLVGAAAGGAYGYLRSNYMTSDALRDSRVKLAYDVHFFHIFSRKRLTFTIRRIDCVQTITRL